MTRGFGILILFVCVGASDAGAAESPLGQWTTVDDKSGKVGSVVEIYDQGGRIFGRTAGPTEPNDQTGKPKICTKCTGVDKGTHRRARHHQGPRPRGRPLQRRYHPGPEDGMVYKTELWVEEGKLKVRGYRGPVYRTQTWLKAK